MKWYWSEKDIPELKQMQMYQRKKIYLKYYLCTFRSWKHWLGLLLFLTLYWLYSKLIILLTINIAPFIFRISLLILSVSLFIGVGVFIYSEIILNVVANQIQRDSNNN
jgi:hypothetical protein